MTEELLPEGETVEDSTPVASNEDAPAVESNDGQTASEESEQSQPNENVPTEEIEILEEMTEEEILDLTLRPLLS